MGTIVSPNKILLKSLNPKPQFPFHFPFSFPFDSPLLGTIVSPNKNYSIWRFVACKGFGGVACTGFWGLGCLEHLGFKCLMGAGGLGYNLRVVQEVSARAAEASLGGCLN